MMLIVVVMVVFLGEELPLSCFSFRLFTVVICQLLLLLFVVWFGLLLLTFTCCLPRPTAIDGPSGRRDVCNESFREQLID